ncbi:MAG: bifunctional 23S rRNA (guanine(2069)-N(7))-methyltransferase RlmK/23S rRNA (guanine(2445)-N(2))-methyltransferase RlmL, partial [Deltaproteobacteria bacterium]|nr:bifunctional 23S rRNA (guanine(2069)-N(7))-methyltransferase RlmK/23S rRNA (guanine(2445)-N(2))-methyltransferase RlmL [Deltaproteobacteria bacterium]
MNEYNFVVTSALAIEDLVAAELQNFGAHAIKPGRAVVHACGSLEVIYRTCLWSRVASRVLLPITTFSTDSVATLYDAIYAIDWQKHLGPDDTLAVDFSERDSAISHTHFGAQKIKDAIVDKLRDIFGRRPDIDRITPKLRINVRLENSNATVAIDMSGASLHRRGYRLDSTTAPMRETLAAAVLLRSRWPQAADEQKPLIDPMCGSGTLLIEAALIALNRAPQLTRKHFGFLGWRGHKHDIWNHLLKEANDQKKHNYTGIIQGSDINAATISAARDNAVRAKVSQLIQFSVKPFTDLFISATATKPGMIVVNPPYGERLGDEDQLQQLYKDFGQTLKSRFGNWSAHVLTSSIVLAKSLGLTAKRTNTLMNGALSCQLLHCDIHSPKDKILQINKSPKIDEALANRLHKNLRRLERWASREKIDCYRIYDADLPEFAAAIDRYNNHIVLQEYAPPAHIDKERARQRLMILKNTVQSVTQIPLNHIVIKTRRRQKPGELYEKLNNLNKLINIQEGQCKFLVNLTDYLDTGLFLDSRLIRRLIGELAKGCDFLNLFAYTGSATVYAALGAARSTTSVDLSKTYLSWAERNLHLNGFEGRQHKFIQADCRVWLENNQNRYGLILLDPPTFSSSKRMDGTLDIQRDHSQLINNAVRLLTKDGILIFSTNYRRFKLDKANITNMQAIEITAETIPI